MIRIDSYFSGAGIFDIGFEMEGIEVQNSFEIDPICVETLRLNGKESVEPIDVSKKLVKDGSDANVILATYPCTKYSAAADIFNVRTGDDLYLHFFRHVAIHQPDVYVLENVPGMKKFPLVMEAMTQLPDYYVSIFCPVNSNLWLPQNRKRLIIIGSRKRFNWIEPTSNHKITLKDILEDNPEVKISTAIRKRLTGSYRDLPIISDPEKGDIAPTCVAHYSKDRSTRLVVDKRSELGVRPYTVREYARLMGVPDSYQFAGTENQQYKQIGNGVPVPIGRWVAKELKRYFNTN